MMTAAINRWDREDDRYCDPSSQRYAAQLAAVVFGWRTSQHFDAEDAIADTVRHPAEELQSRAD